MLQKSFAPEILIIWLVWMSGSALAQTLASAPSRQSFGQVTVNGTPAKQPLGYTFSGTVNPVFSLAYSSEYTMGSPACTGSGAITCTVSVTFQPRQAGLRQNAVLVKDGSGKLLATTLLYGTGLAPQLVLGPGIISTAAGLQGGLAYAGDGGPATKARLSNPQGIAVDNAGNVYIADSLNLVVRKVDAATGKISTIAGSPQAGGRLTGDGGAALQAGLNNPMGLALDGAGNLYIADQGNNVVREVIAATGIIVTVAGGGTGSASSDGLGDGGQAINAILSGPSDIAVDGAGNLFIADSFDHAIRRVDAATGIITAVSAGPLNDPTSVAVDATGNLYISDNGNRVIRRVDTSGNVTIVAGGGSSTMSLIPATSAKLGSPVCIRLDAAGNLYITDQARNVVREVSAQTGLVQTIAGTGVAGYSGDGAVATAAQMTGPAGLALDGSGSVYVADTENNVVRRISSPSGLTFPQTIAGEASQAQAVTVSNVGNQSLNLTGLSVSRNFSQAIAGADCSSSTALLPGAVCNVGLQFAPTAVGTQTGILALTHNSLNVAGSTQSFSLTGQAISGAVPQFSLSVGSLTFAPRAMGTTSPAQSITVTNTGAAPLSISGGSLTGVNNFDFNISSNCPSSLAANASCSISVSFTPLANGPRTAQLTLVNNLASPPPPIALTGIGGAAQIALSPATLVFDGEPVGATSPAKTVTIANTGSAALNIVSMALAGANASDFSETSTCGSTVAAGSSCSVTVTFAPRANGIRSATLSLTGSGGFGQALSVSGTGGLASNVEKEAARYYAAADQHIHELYIDSGAWHDLDLTATTGGPKVPAGASVASLIDTIGNVIRVSYAAVDQHVHQLYIDAGAWHDYDLTAASGGPNVAPGTVIANLIDTIQNALRISYAGTDQHMHQLYLWGGAWHDYDLTAAAGGPKLALGSAIANLVDTTQNVFRISYTGADQHIHQFYIWQGGWHDFDLTAATGAPTVATGSAIANLVDTTQNALRISYTGADQHVHQFYIWAGAWHDFDLTGATAGPKIAAGGSIANLLDTTQSILRIDYAAADQHVHEFYISGGAWHDFDLTAAARALNVPPAASIAGLVDATQNVLRINYTGIDEHNHQFYISGGAWHDYDITAATGGPLTTK